MSKKILKILSLVILIAIIPCLFVFATGTPDKVILENPLGEDSILGIINRGLSFLLWISITIGTFIIMWAGFLYITSQGNPDKAAMAVKVIANVLIGIAIVLLSKGIVSLTYNILTGSKTPVSNTSATGSQTAPTIKLSPFP